MLDSGIYYRKGKPIFGYNRESCEVIKSHLEDLIPDVFFEYDDKGTQNYTEYGFNYKGFNIIFLNREILLKNFEMNPKQCVYKNSEEEKIFKHYSMRVSKTMMHEIFAHFKIYYDKSKGIGSPLKFYNRNKILVKMIYCSSKVDKNDKDEYMNVLSDNLESGKLFEYFYGTFDGRLIIDYIYELDNLENLYNNVDYFVKENLDELKKYIINKYKIV